MSYFLSDPVADVCELIQDDLTCLLDGYSQQLINKACQIVVDRMRDLKDVLSDAS